MPNGRNGHRLVPRSDVVAHFMDDVVQVRDQICTLQTILERMTEASRLIRTGAAEVSNELHRVSIRLTVLMRQSAALEADARIPDVSYSEVTG